MASRLFTMPWHEIKAMWLRGGLVGLSSVGGVGGSAVGRGRALLVRVLVLVARHVARLLHQVLPARDALALAGVVEPAARRSEVVL